MFCSGDDVSRSLFMFASGKVLGKRGLEWLKIHLINLTGLKKYENLKTRLAYADQVSDWLKNINDIITVFLEEFHKNLTLFFTCGLLDCAVTEAKLLSLAYSYFKLTSITIMV